MRRAILTLLVSLCAVLSAGCLAMSTNTRMGSQYDAVVIDDRVLIVNKCTSRQPPRPRPATSRPAFPARQRGFTQTRRPLRPITRAWHRRTPWTV